MRFRFARAHGSQVAAVHRFGGSAVHTGRAVRTAVRTVHGSAVRGGVCAVNTVPVSMVFSVLAVLGGFGSYGGCGG